MAMKNLGKRIFAIALAMVMCFSALHLTPLAANGEDQIMDGYYVLNPDHSVSSTTDATSVTEDGFTLTKTIEAKGENQFEITLQVITSEEVVTSDAAIQLVIDTSSSMEECSESCNSYVCRHNDRLEAVKSILTQNGGFLDSLTAGNTGKVYVSVVSFGKNARTVCDWTDIKNTSGLAAVKSAINGLTSSDNATNMHAGLMLARNRLTNGIAANAGTKFTVLLSDGEANCVGAESSSLTSISLSGFSPMSASATPAGTTGATAMAATLSSIGTVYAIGYGVREGYLNGIIGNDKNVFTGANAQFVSEAFANIAQSAVNGMSGAGSVVTDPMGQFIILGDTSALPADQVTANGNALSWTLDPANAQKTTSGNVTTYTYSISYPITLDVSAQGFQGDVYYPTNGYTYLSVPQENGTSKQIAFLVPGVCGTVPQYSWTVEYYLQNDQGGYTLESTDNMGLAQLWSSVNAPEGYATKFSKQHYEFASGNTTMQITAGENVMKLYYNYDMANVTVNHFYKTTVINADGTVTKGTYPEIPQVTDSDSKWIGTSFSAEQQNQFGGAVYELDRVDPRSAEITVSAEESENVINFYYSREDDRRATTSAEVKHIYKTYGYELQNGEYVLVEKSSVTESAQIGLDLKATTTFVVNATAPLSGYADFSLNTEAGDYASLLQSDSTLSFVLADNAEDNVRTLVFEKVVDDRVPVSVTVNHYYTKSTTFVLDGNVVTTVAPNNELGKSETFDGFYAGETFAATQSNVYAGDSYLSDADNAAKCAEIALQGNTTIDLYYNLTIVPQSVSITINHYWRTFTDVTVEKIDPETGKVIGTEVVPQSSVDHKVENIIVSDLYEGQFYTAALQSIPGGYTFNEQDSNRDITVTSGAVINLFYDRSATDDARTDASIDVLHTYTTYLTTIVGGKVETLTLNDGIVSEESITMKAGDSFTATSQPSYNGASYTQTTPASALTTILQPGTNSTIVIDYVRQVNELIPTTYSVDYLYKTYTMTVNEEGQAGYWNAPAVETTGSVANVPGFAGEQVVLPAGEREGFAPLADNPATVQILNAEANHWTFVYEKYIPLGQGSITVNHHYETTTIAENGTATVSTEDVFGTAKQMYLGESFLAQSQSGTFTLVSATVDGSEATAEEILVTVSGDNVVDFYYKKTVDNSRTVHYTVSHVYNLYTYNGQLIASQKAEGISGSGFVTTQVTVAPSPSGYSLVSASYNDTALAAPYTFTLADGKNEVIFVYEKYEPRAEVDITVIHNYYEDEASVGNTAVEVYEEHISGISEDSNYTAQLRDLEGFEFHSAIPGSRTITATKDGDNLIVLNYTRIVVEEPPVEEPPVEEPPVEEIPEEEPPVEEIPEEDVPLVDIPEEDVPLIDIPDEDIPLADVPKTGDPTVLYAALTAMSGLGLTVLGMKKKEEDTEK